MPMVPFELVVSKLLITFPRTVRLSFFLCLKRFLHVKTSANKLFLSYLEGGDSFSSNLLKKKEPVLSDFSNLETFFGVGIEVIDTWMKEIKAATPGYERNMRVMCIRNGVHYCMLKEPRPAKKPGWICEKCGFETWNETQKLRHENRKISCEKKKRQKESLSQVAAMS